MIKTEEPNLLNREECNVMRGFAIMAVASNNFGHLIKDVIQDNEFVYDYSQVTAFLEALKLPSQILPLDFLAFFSPFGVMLFIFLSGYGLTLKYEKGNGKQIDHKTFVIDHYTKLFQMQIKGLAMFLLVMFIFNSNYIVYFRHLLGQILMVENLNPIDPIILAGPYWFFGMIMEVYIIYRFAIFRRSSSFVIAVSLLSLILMAFCEPNGETIRYLRINFLMAILPFCLGVLVARYESFLQLLYGNRMRCWISLVFFLILLTISKFNFYTWLVMPLFIVGLSISLAKILFSSHQISVVFEWIGRLSGIIFVIHPIVREILIERTNQSGNYYGMFFVYLLMTLVLSIIFKPIFSKKA